MNAGGEKRSENHAWKTSSSTGISDDDQPEPTRARGPSAARDQGTSGQGLGEVGVLGSAFVVDVTGLAWLSFCR